MITMKRHSFEPDPQGFEKSSPYLKKARQTELAIIKYAKPTEGTVGAFTTQQISVT